MLPKTIVGFSVSDLEYYWRMLAWKGTEGIDFHFADCRLDSEANNNDEEYIKARAREGIGSSEKYALLIGEDTGYQYN
jgi:hypothetical protein